ncbi:MAG TPA: nucleotidyltransferase domain-containing protein [Thermoflexia bacterium]|jgi:predicted nucleotidyltransferase|nr:nucleotidyltransferase domain-containing protein [Thermoflexia bacterium]
MRENDVLQTLLQVIQDILAAHSVHLEQVFLFGSRARGQGAPHSDWDLYVLVAEDLQPQLRHRLITEIKRELARRRIPNDIVIQSVERFQRIRMYPGHLSYEVAREGVPLL